MINEFVASNQTGITDESGAAPDWMELYNLGDAEVDLAGYFVSDDPDDPYKAELPTGLSIAAGGFLLLWADGDPEEGPNHLPFNLAKAGESIVITSPMGEPLDRIDYTDAVTDVSLARVPDGTGEFVSCANPTPAASNDAGCGS